MELLRHDRTCRFHHRSIGSPSITQLPHPGQIPIQITLEIALAMSFFDFQRFIIMIPTASIIILVKTAIFTVWLVVCQYTVTSRTNFHSSPPSFFAQFHKIMLQSKDEAEFPNSKITRKMFLIIRKNSQIQ